MTVTARRNDPQPVVTPPATYDIIGLTRKQAELIRDILGLMPPADADRNGVDSLEVYDALISRLGTSPSFEFENFHGTDGAIETLRARPL